MDTFIAIIMYCLRLFLLFTGKQHCLHYFFFRGPTCKEYLSSCKISSSVVLWFWQYSSSTSKKKKKIKEHEKTCFAVFPRCYVEIQFIFVEFIPFCMFLTLMSLEMEIT